MNTNQLDVIKRLGEVSRMLDAATEELAVLDETAVRSKQTFEVDYAREFLSAEGPVDVRKHMATIHTAVQRLTYELDVAKHRACKERINTLRNQLSTGQTVSAALRHQFAAEATGQWT